MLKIPARKFHGETMSCLVYVLHLAHINERQALRSGGASDTLLGYRIPFFQRKDDRWTREQQVAFIESMYMGANIGAFMVNLPMQFHPVQKTQDDEQTVNVLLDGLQRLTALKAYFSDEFTVDGADGQAHHWGNLEPSEQAHLLRIVYPWIQTRYESVDLMKQAYERHNFGGTPHTDEDRVKLMAARP